MGYRQGVRQRTLTPSFRWFESSYPNHVGMDFTPFKKPGLGRAFLIRSVIPPSPQKSRLFRGPQPLRGFAVVAAPIFSLKKSVACSDLRPTRFSPSGEISALLLVEKSWVRNLCFADVSPPSPQKYWQFWVWSLWNIKMDSLHSRSSVFGSVRLFL